MKRASSVAEGAAQAREFETTVEKIHAALALNLTLY